MIVTARTREDFQMFLKFMKERGVALPYSTDLQFIGHMNKKGKILGAVAYNGFMGATCCMHCAGDDNWVNRELLYAAFNYPFNTAKMACVVGPVANSNSKALVFNLHLGFTRAYSVPDGWAEGVDLIIMQMLRHQCRWIQETGNGKQEFVAASA